MTAGLAQDLAVPVIHKAARANAEPCTGRLGLANPALPAHICLMAKTAVAIALLALLGVSLWYAHGLWTSLEDAALPTGLYVAMGAASCFRCWSASG